MRGSIKPMTDELGIVFDLDGVLLNSEANTEWLITALKKTLTHFNFPLTKENIEAIHPRNIWKFGEMSQPFKTDLKKLWHIRNDFYTQEKIKAIKTRAITPFPDVDILYELKDRYQLNIISNSPQEVVDLFISEFKYTDLFTYGIGRGASFEDVKKLKPHPFLFERLIQRSSKKEFLYVGDTEYDRVFAENTGMKFLFLNREGDPKNEFTSLIEVVDHLLKG